MTFPAAAEHLPAFRCPFSLKPRFHLLPCRRLPPVGAPCRKLFHLWIVIDYLKYEDNQLE